MYMAHGPCMVHVRSMYMENGPCGSCRLHERLHVAPRCNEGRAAPLVNTISLRMHVLKCRAHDVRLLMRL